MTFNEIAMTIGEIGIQINEIAIQINESATHIVNTQYKSMKSPGTPTETEEHRKEISENHRETIYVEIQQ